MTKKTPVHVTLPYNTDNSLEIRTHDMLNSCRLKRTAFQLSGTEGRMHHVRDLIAIASFIVAVIGGLTLIFNKNRDKQTMAGIVGIVFLISFFLLVTENAKRLYQVSCLVTFAMAILGGVVAMYSNEKSRRDGAMITGIVSLGTSLFIFFTYLEFHLF